MDPNSSRETCFPPYEGPNGHMPEQSRQDLPEAPEQALSRLFPASLPDSQWCSFVAQGFTRPVAGVVYRPERAPCCGMPLGGVGTGCLDIDVRGVLGFSNLFNIGYMEKAFSGFPGNIFRSPLTRRQPDYPPFLGLSSDGKTWVLAAKVVLEGGRLETCTDPLFTDRQETIELQAVHGVGAVQSIDYWGHYPVVDIEYQLEVMTRDEGEPAAGLAVGLRAWAPFIPGDVEASHCPCAFFQVYLRNHRHTPQEGTLAFSFPGPVPPELEDEAQRAIQVRRFARAFRKKQGREPTQRELAAGFRPDSAPQLIRRTFSVDALQGIEVSDGRNSYVLGALDQEAVRLGGELGRNGTAWGSIACSLPTPEPWATGSSIAVDFHLEACATAEVTFVLAWHASEWQGANEHFYAPVYSRHFGCAREVAEHAASRKAAWLHRVLAWQEVVYSEEGLPPWLRDTLINNLALIPETSYWATAAPPLGDWCYQEGFFGMLESPRGCPQIECIPCTWYGNLPITLFFPELARSTLEGYRYYQREDGAVPFVIGRWGRPDMATPSWDWQISLNGCCYVDLVDRLWQRTGDDAVLQHFYPSVKQTLTMTLNLRPPPEGVISMPEDNRGMEWFEWGEWLGMCSHLGGIRLSTVLLAERMAQAMGDAEFATQCLRWFQDGSKAMEEKMWAGSYYLNYYEEETGCKSDAIMGYQLDGEWAAKLHGVRSVFRPDRVGTVLETIRSHNMPEVICGALNFATPEGRVLSSDEQIAEYGGYAMFLPEVMILGMTYLYAGQREFGLQFLERALAQMVCVERHPWDLPNVILGDTGKRHFGTDYYQNMILWAVPVALERQDLQGFCRSGGLVDRIIRAGRGGGTPRNVTTGDARGADT